MSKYGNRYNWTDELKNKLIKEYGPYGSAPIFAKENNISLHSVYKMANALGLKQRPKNRWYDSDTGYMRVKIPETGKVMSEHAFVYLLETGETVPKGHVLHHKNKNKLDNRIENLQLLTRKQHVELHRDDIVRSL